MKSFKHTITKRGVRRRNGGQRTLLVTGWNWNSINLYTNANCFL